jgi:hypothetical protein
MRRTAIIEGFAALVTIDGVNGGKAGLRTA